MTFWELRKFEQWLDTTQLWINELSFIFLGEEVVMGDSGLSLFEEAG
jgi:hypothetical protein